ncbi:uracil-DNA glycosylase family protein [Sphingobacterium suaedae]|uniref:Uracil-DNA glycosylase family protein n=1 Tax=Sphingobacterium suaedae TaxID=1686402 RepID=A0ABW5KKW0_9SPHI
MLKRPIFGLGKYVNNIMTAINEGEEARRLYKEIRFCTHCEPELPCGANPVLSIDARAKILIVGQAPGSKVHDSGIPWNDQSGRELRNWLGVTEDEFYNPQNFAIVPMGFCYPGKGKQGDLPPKKVCAPMWHPAVNAVLKHVKLTLLIGKYAQDYYLPTALQITLTKAVADFALYLPDFFPLPHPSPRNFIWKARNPWFNESVLPVLKDEVQKALYG